jgi:hypothetical protein
MYTLYILYNSNSNSNSNSNNNVYAPGGPRARTGSARASRAPGPARAGPAFSAIFIAFWPSIPPLQVAPSFACPVASLSRSRVFNCQDVSLHCGILADYLLGWGRPSTCSTGHAEFQSTSSSSPHWATGDWVLPACIFPQSWYCQAAAW